MKKMVTVQEVEGEGLIKLLEEYVILLCMNYFYAGKLIGINKDVVLLSDASIVYETGEWSASKWKDAQKVGNELYVQIDKIEAYCKGKP